MPHQALANSSIVARVPPATPVAEEEVEEEEEEVMVAKDADLRWEKPTKITPGGKPNSHPEGDQYPTVIHERAAVR